MDAETSSKTTVGIFSSPPPKNLTSVQQAMSLNRENLGVIWEESSHVENTPAQAASNV